MGLLELERAAQMFFEMCRLHPELCPHDYYWSGSITDKKTGKCMKRYTCGVCRHEKLEGEK